jgi:UDP-GlcNAc3NAcA epimerase
VKILSVVGARPQFIKSAPVSRQLRRTCQEVLLHTGQHYDYGMSQVFFDELEIPVPDINLGIGSAGHGQQTGLMLAGIESAILKEEPDWVLVYGDTNSTLAGALAAVKLHVPVAHVEAGLRSFNKAMPEEVNRVLTDHVADLLFCPTQSAVDNLSAEGIQAGVHNTGDVMYDALLHNSALAKKRSTVLGRMELRPHAYSLATLHRPRNTDNLSRLQAIFNAFGQVEEQIILPLHPRTKKVIDASSQNVPSNVRLIDPVGYLDMLCLERAARIILTDSGGVQKEAYCFGVPCITLREETEWIETVEVGWNRLAGAETGAIVSALHNVSPPSERPPLFGDGHAAERIAAILEST